MEDITEKATVELGAGRISDTRVDRSTSLGSTGRTLASPIDALHLDEIARTRRLSIVGITLAISASASTFVFGGDLTARAALYVGMGLLLLANGWLFAATSDPARYQRRVLGVVWVSGSLGCVAAGYYFGILSPAAAGTLLGVYFVSLGESTRIAAAVFAVVALGWAVIGVLIAVGAIGDVGIVRTPFLTTPQMLAGLVMTELLYASAFFLARASRRVTAHSMTELERAVRAVAQRDGLLFEAQRDLDRALRIGGPGRYTNEMMGPFLLGPVIGRGAMGEVYEAIDSVSSQPAAVKVLPAEALADEQGLRRFVREIEAVGALDTSHVVKVLAASAAADPIPWFAMERLRGTDLAQLLRQHRSLDAERALEIIQQVARGVDAAAACGIVHRDLKPQNLFRDERDGLQVWKILDFGVSKLRDSEGTLTQGHVVGTPVYMSPEQAQGLAVDHRADIYALAAVAYRTLTGHPPFRGNDTAAILYRVVYQMPARPSALAELPAAVDAVLAIGLAKAAASRFPSGAALSVALDAALRGRLAPELSAAAADLLEQHPWATEL
jgi:serine/threonine-protein kinase